VIVTHPKQPEGGGGVGNSPVIVTVVVCANVT